MRVIAIIVRIARVAQEVVMPRVQYTVCREGHQECGRQQDRSEPVPDAAAEQRVMHPLMHEQHEGVERKSGGDDPDEFPASNGQEDTTGAEPGEEGDLSRAPAPILR